MKMKNITDKNFSKKEREDSNEKIFFNSYVNDLFFGIWKKWKSKNRKYKK